MRCTEVVESMHRYLDNDLNEEEVAEMLGHIAGCQQCAEAFRMLKALTQELENLPRVVPKYSLVDAIMPQLDALDRARLEKAASVELQPAEMIPIVDIKRKVRFRPTGITRTLIGVAAAVGILGVAIYNSPPQQLSDAQVQEQVVANAEVTASAEDRSMKTGAVSNSMSNDSNSSANNELSPVENPTDELDSPELESDTMVAPPVNPDQQKSSPSLKSNNDVVSPSSSNVNEQDPVLNDSSSIADQPSIARMVEPEPTGNDVEGEIPVDELDNEPLQASIVDPVPNQQRIMDDIVGFRSQVATTPETVSTSTIFDSPDGTMSAVIEKEKLIIYRLSPGIEQAKTVIQSIDLVGIWVNGEWSLDSTVFTYQIELGGKTSVYTYPDVAEVVTTP